jgi:hypothetical protein
MERVFVPPIHFLEGGAQTADRSATKCRHTKLQDTHNSNNQVCLV